MKNGEMMLVLYNVSGMNKDHILALTTNGAKGKVGETLYFPSSNLCCCFFYKDSAVIMIFGCHYH